MYTLFQVGALADPTDSGKRADPEALGWVGGVGTTIVASWRGRLPLEAGENIVEADGAPAASADTSTSDN